MVDNYDIDDEELESKGGPIGEMAKKLLAVGIGAAFLTEESIRAQLKGMKLPKDLLNSILQGANKSKEDIVNRVSDEVVKIVRKIDFVEEASRFVEEHKFKISAEIEVQKKQK